VKDNLPINLQVNLPDNPQTGQARPAPDPNPKLEDLTPEQRGRRFQQAIERHISEAYGRLPDDGRC